jgi:hypothetical protein
MQNRRSQLIQELRSIIAHLTLGQRRRLRANTRRLVSAPGGATPRLPGRARRLTASRPAPLAIGL